MFNNDKNFKQVEYGVGSGYVVGLLFDFFMCGCFVMVEDICLCDDFNGFYQINIMFFIIKCVVRDGDLIW